ncbi:MAG TPA: hypothetical protein VJO16_16875 [Candidatus Acidoferrum sp.]|nr:hypothetical protein [Candidatus Acidoferrum sp.]
MFHLFAKRTLRILCGLLVLAWPFAAAFAQSSSSDQSSSSSQQSSGPAQTPSQAQPATLDPPPAKQDSLAEAARKAKAKKPDVPPKGKVYTEDDLKGMKGPGVSVVGDPPRKNTRRSQPADDPDGDNGQNPEEYWRGRAQQFLDAIAQTDEQIAQKREEIKKFGSGGFDVMTGRKDNIAYIHDRNAELKQLEAHKADLEKQFEELQDEGRKAGALPSWFR